MKRLVILSGKGGTGKTTTAAAFLRFGQIRASADCDVDAPNLHILNSQSCEPATSEFMGGEKAQIDPAACIGCGSCHQHCRFDAIRKLEDSYTVDLFSCEGCGVCQLVCPVKAISLVPDQAGTKYLYRQDGSVFSTASLKMGRGNSGKLVTQVKMVMLKNAPDCDLALADGSPGIGCPVIASVSGMDLALIVAEPSLSGISDLNRLIRSAETMETKLAVCVNKWDISPENTERIQKICEEKGIPFLGKIPYDGAASTAVNAGKSLADIDCPAREALYAIYVKTSELLGI